MEEQYGKQETAGKEGNAEAAKYSGQAVAVAAVRGDSKASEEKKPLKDPRGAFEPFTPEVGSRVFIFHQYKFFFAIVTHVHDYEKGVIDACYLDPKTGNWGPVSKVERGIKHGHWWHSVEEMRLAVDYDRALREQGQAAK